MFLVRYYLIKEFVHLGSVPEFFFVLLVSLIIAASYLRLIKKIIFSPALNAYLLRRLSKISILDLYFKDYFKTALSKQATGERRYSYCYKGQSVFVLYGILLFLLICICFVLQSSGIKALVDAFLFAFLAR